MDTIDFLDELTWRGMLHQATDEAGLRGHLETPGRLAYAGFDPTATSLTIGNLVPIMALRHFQRAGHRPVVLMGGGTGLIGDPSGKSAERTLMTVERVEDHVSAQRPIFESLLDFDVPDAQKPVILNNHDWLGSLNYIELLRDVGKHFRVNEMVKKDSVRDRLDREQGISYTEFSYMILQAYDFAHLFENDGVSIQLGGSDQFGNIVAGTDLIRRRSAEEDAERAAFGLTCPLITKADGGKFGKTESGAVWLSAPREDGEVGTTPYGYYQFWLNAADADMAMFLRTFTLLGKDEIEDLEARHAEAPHKREAQRTLARHATALLHGAEAVTRAEAAAAALFSGDLVSLSETDLRDVFAGIPSSDHAKASLEGEGVDPVELLVETGLAESKKKAREFIAAGSVIVGPSKIGEGERVTTDRMLAGGVIPIRRGKKNWHLTRWA